MAAKQPEIVRKLDDGFLVAWDTTEVPDEVREEFQVEVGRHIDMFVKILEDDGREASVIVELKKGAQSPASRLRTGR